MSRDSIEPKCHHDTKAAVVRDVHPEGEVTPTCLPIQAKTSLTWHFGVVDLYFKTSCAHHLQPPVGVLSATDPAAIYERKGQKDFKELQSRQMTIGYYVGYCRSHVGSMSIPSCCEDELHLREAPFLQRPAPI